MTSAASVDTPPKRARIRRLPPGPVYAGLSFCFGVRCADPALARYLEAVLWPLRSAKRADHWFSVDATSVGRIEVRLDGVRVAGARDAGNAAAWLLWYVNRAVVDASEEYVLLHAAGVTWAGWGIVLPGAPGSGKTTLAAGLVQRGLGYLSDEVVALADDDLTIEPFPKAFAFDVGSITALWGAAPQRGPEGDGQRDDEGRDGEAEEGLAGAGGPRFEMPGAEKTNVVPDRVRAGAASGPSVARMVVAPRYRPGCPTALVRVDGADALMTLVTNAVNMERHGSAGARRLAGLAQAGVCYRLEFSDLDDACRLVTAEADRCMGEEAAG